VAKRGRPKSKMQLNMGVDPSLYRYASLTEALSASTDILAQLIRQGDHQKVVKESMTTPSDEQEVVSSH